MKRNSHTTKVLGSPLVNFMAYLLGTKMCGRPPSGGARILWTPTTATFFAASFFTATTRFSTPFSTPFSTLLDRGVFYHQLAQP